MNADQWRRIRELFHEASELPAPQQREFVQSRCDDSALRDEVFSLLRQDADAAAFMDDPALGASFAIRADELADDVVDAPDRWVGATVGTYRIEEKLASGGMGTVYRAVRADQEYQTQVALKIMKPGLEPAHFIRRFLHERQTLANLNHPNIARLLDGGRTPDGLPYLVMEFIDGVPIDQYCDQQQLTVRQRLELFRTVCAAVHVAHQNLVVHRDIKPGNILVTRDGVPKLLDFGIAKVLAPTKGEQREPETRNTGMQFLTPQYASPEQVRGEPVTIETDVYSLGVVLYVLLTSRLPYAFTTRRMADIERTIGDQPPEKPSTAIRRLTTGANANTDRDTIGRARSTSPERLRRQLRGDLDNIIMMALRKEPHRRYQSVEQFSADINRYLHGMPVIARRDTFAYRWVKFMQRNRIGVAAGVAVMIAIGAGIVATLWQAQVALREAEHARIEAESANRAADFLIQIFQQADPRIRGVHEVTARELLDRAAESIPFELTGQPHLRANLIDTLGRVYMNLGAYAQAENMIQQALEIRRETFGEVSEEYALSLRSVGELAYTQGRFPDAEQAFREALRLHRTLKRGVHVDVSEALNNLGAAVSAQGKLEEAATLHQEALQLRRAKYGERSLEAAESLNNLARVLMTRGDYEGAEKDMRQVLEIRRQLLGDHPDVAQALNNLAVVLQHQGRHAEALEPYEQAVAQYRKLYGAHPDLARTQAGMGALLLSLGRDDEALAALEDALAMQREFLPAEHPSTATTLLHLGKAQAQRGEMERAENYLREAVQIQRALLGDVHPNLAATLTELAHLHVRRGDHAGAVPLWEETVRIYDTSLPGHWFIGVAKAGLAVSVDALNERERALQLAEEAHDILRKTRGEDDSSTKSVAALLAQLRGG